MRQEPPIHNGNGVRDGERRGRNGATESSKSSIVLDSNINIALHPTPTLANVIRSSKTIHAKTPITSHIRTNLQKTITTKEAEAVSVDADVAERTTTTTTKTNPRTRIWPKNSKTSWPTWRSGNNTPPPPVAPVANEIGQQQERHVHFQEAVEYPDQERYQENDNNNNDDQGTYLLDSSANPSHVINSQNTSNPLPSPVSVATPNGPYILTHSTEFRLPPKAGTISTNAFINHSMRVKLISPLPIIRQLGPVILTAKGASVLPIYHHLISQALLDATPIARMHSGVYELSLHQSKHPPCAHKPMIPFRPKSVTPPTPKTRPKYVSVLATTVRAKRKRVLDNQSGRPRPSPPLKVRNKHQQDQLMFDYHFLFNHASPQAIMATLRNPSLQLDKDRTPGPTPVRLMCDPFQDGKNRAAQHRRKTHMYAPGEAFSSDVAGPIKFKGD